MDQALVELIKTHVLVHEVYGLILECSQRDLSRWRHIRSPVQTGHNYHPFLACSRTISYMKGANLIILEFGKQEDVKLLIY